MNTKAWALAAAAALAVSLAGCMPVQNNTQNSDGQDQTENTTQNQTAIQNPFNKNQTSQEQVPATAELKIQGENGVETVEATIYTGSGYTIAVPSEGWTREKNEPQWSPGSNDDVELTIRFYTGKTADEAVKLLQAAEDDYTFQATAQTTLGSGLTATELAGKETERGDGEEIVVAQIIAYFVETESGCYGLILECPEEETARYGGYLAAMANSFTLVQEQAQTGLRQNTTRQ